jgi:hypothetical protein
MNSFRSIQRKFDRFCLLPVYKKNASSGMTIEITTILPATGILYKNG